MIERWACADDCTHPDHNHHDPVPRGMEPFQTGGERSMSDTLSRAPRILPARQPEPEHEPCWGCQGPVPRRERESYSDHLKRHTCSSECVVRVKTASAAQWADLWVELEAMHAPCVICGDRLSRKPEESRSRFVERMTCGAEACVAAARKRAGCREPQSHYPTRVQETRQLAEIDFGDGFRLNQVVDRERGIYRRMTPPDAVTLGGVSSRWMGR